MTVDWLRVQTRLKELGFDPGPLDGLRGPRTDAAVVAFKRSIGLRARPYVGPLTLEALFPGPVSTSHAGTLPWMQAAQAVRGLHERRNTSQLRNWFHQSVAWIDPREIAWCGAYVQTAMRMAYPRTLTPENPLGARNWRRYGIARKPCFGSIMVFWRGSITGWQGHVAFYVGEDTEAYHVLGANQRDAVNVTRITKQRFLAARWPAEAHKLVTRPIFLDRSGIPLSHNEA